MDYDIDMSDIQVMDWKGGGIPRSVVSTSKPTSQGSSAVPTSSRIYSTHGEYGIGVVPTSYTNASSYGSSSSSSYGSGSSSQYYYNYSANHHEQPKRIETATSETQAGWDWIDMDNIEEIDYSNTSTPELDAIDEGVNGSKKPIEQVDYSKPSVRATVEGIDYSTRKRVTFSESNLLNTSKKGQNTMLPPPTRLSANGVEIPREAL